MLVLNFFCLGERGPFLAGVLVGGVGEGEIFFVAVVMVFFALACHVAIRKHASFSDHCRLSVNYK